MQIHARRCFGIGHKRLVMEEPDQRGTLLELIANRPLANDFLRLFQELRGEGGSIGRCRTTHGLTPFAKTATMSMQSPRSVGQKSIVENPTVICETDHLEVVEHQGKGFQVVPFRWVVERTFAWLLNYRRHRCDYEILTDNSAAMIQISMIHLLLNRLA